MEPDFYKITGTATIDEGSRVAFQTVYASINDSEYFPLTTLKNSEVFIQLDPDSLYKFYSISVDNVGNYKREKTNYEVSTLNVGVKISGDKISDYLHIYPNPANNILYINCNFAYDGRLIIYLTDMLGRNVIFENVGYVSMGEFTKQISLVSLEDLKSGTYILTIQHNQKKYLKFISIQR